MTKGRNNNNRSNNNGGNRKANKPGRVAKDNHQHSTRKFRAVANIFCQQSGTSGLNGVLGAFAYTFPLSSYTGYTFVEDNFEEYKVTNVEVLMKPSAGTLNNGTAPTTTTESILYQNSVYSAMNGTYALSFIDYDTATNPTFGECQTRVNLKTRALSPNNWTMIASFQPRTLSNQGFSGGTPSNTFANMWMSTNNMGAQLYGVRGIIANSAPVFDTQDNVLAVDVRLQLTVQMRGPKNTNTSTTFNVLPSSYIPLPVEGKQLTANVNGKFDVTDTTQTDDTQSV